MSARVEEIRQENRSGDVSFNDVEWLCQVADAAELLVSQLFAGIRHQDYVRVRELLGVTRPNFDGLIWSAGPDPDA